MKNEGSRAIELQKLIDLLKQCKSEGVHYYLDLKSNGLCKFTDRDAEQDETGFFMQILYDDDNRFLSLPIVGDNDEYLDLCCFIHLIDNEALHTRLVRCSKGKGAVKRIKKELRRLNLMPQWEWYRNRYYFWSAIEWAMQNGIELIG